MKNKQSLKLKQNEIYGANPDLEDPVGRARCDTIDFLLGDGDPITDEDFPVPQSDGDLDELITALRKERKAYPEYSLFGDPNWKMIDVEIEICEWAKSK